MVIPYARNASFYWPIDELRNADQSIQKWPYFDNRRSTHCQLDACKQCWSAQIWKTSSAFPKYTRFEAKRAVVCCSLTAYKEPKLPGTSFSGRALYTVYSRCKISASEARVCAERKISIFWVEKLWHFFISLPSSPPFFLFLFSFLVLGIYWASFRQEMFWGTQDLWYQKEESAAGQWRIFITIFRLTLPFFCLFILACFERYFALTKVR